MYRVTWHARQRANERGVAPDEIAMALAGRAIPMDGRIYHYSNGCRVVVITTENGTILTTFRAKKAWVKKHLSGSKRQQFS